MAAQAFDAADRFDLQNSSRWLWGDSRNRPSDFMQEDVALVHPIKIAAMGAPSLLHAAGPMLMIALLAGAAQAKEMIKQWLFKSETYWAVKSY